MPSTKKPARDKRAVLPRASDHTRQFRKDWERLSRTGRYDMAQLKEASPHPTSSYGSAIARGMRVAARAACSSAPAL